MRLLWGAKDGGPASMVWMWGIESKRLGSILVLRFAAGSREAYHTHAFNAVSWLLSGNLTEHQLPDRGVDWSPTVARMCIHWPGLRPILTWRSTYHKVCGGIGRSWALTIRGPWDGQWREYLPNEDRQVELTHGRKELP